MSRFLKPEHGNQGRGINSVRNLIRWLNRQARDRRDTGAPPKKIARAKAAG